jgi:hypothetical protein
VRTLALGDLLASELFDHRARTAFESPDELVFCHPLTGAYSTTGATRSPCGSRSPARGSPITCGRRHTWITNAAAAGMSAPALMARAGHSDFKRTQGYIDLAGETFRDEEALFEARLFGQKTGQK